jgi:hypothetical protein
MDMSDTAQRLSVVLEFQDQDDGWATVAILIDDKGYRRRTTLGRFQTRAQAAEHLQTVYASLPGKARKVA